MELRDVLNVDTILVDWNPVTKDEAIADLVEALDRAHLCSDRDQVLRDVKEREASLSTGLEDGIAYPHARSDGVEEVAMAFGIVSNGIQFDSRDKKPALFIPMMVSPKRGGTPHIYFMAEIVKLLEQQEIREQLLHSDSPEKVYNILTQNEGNSVNT
ncbi:MAG TPA: PTS sugar transporter subunit IIA [bacterium]|nr:PTS sugar transporter subunit IIA [bacterium]